MSRTKKFKLGIHYHLLIQIWRLELSTCYNMCLIYKLCNLWLRNWRFQTWRLHKQTAWSFNN